MTDWDAGSYEITATQLAPASARAVEAAQIAPGEPLVAALTAGNEDPSAFRATSEALLIRIDRS